jgi:hypothetical protein
MKQKISFLGLLLLAATVFAQAPGKFSFQALVRDANGDVVKNSNVGVRIQILKTTETGTPVYAESHQVTTNEAGLVTLAIGGGLVENGTIEAIDWKEGPYFIKTEFDPTGGTNYSMSGTSQLLSVPYALYANTSVLPNDAVSTPTQPNTGDLLYYDGNQWNILDPGDEGQLLTMINGIPAWKDAPTGNELTPLHEPILSIIFKDDPINHNMHIASDGNYYYTCNGGGYTSGRINKYTLRGDSVTSYPISLDMRGLMYNKSDGHLYASGFEANISERNMYRIDDLETGAFVKVHSNLYDYNQASVAMSDDGMYLYAFNKGTLKQYKFSDGSLVGTVNSLSYGTSNYGGDGAVAIDPDYIYTWDATTRTVYIYTHTGTFVDILTLTHGDNGMSLSFVNGYLFVSLDGNYGIGTWYGYNIRKKTATNVFLNSIAPEAETRNLSVKMDSTRE